jgi:hypothetical protein
MRADSDGLRALLDHREISDLLTRASRAIDRLDVDLLKSVFWEHATDNRGVVQGNAQGMAADLVLFVRRAFTATQHILCNCSIELDGDRAAAETYTLSVHRILPSEENLSMLFGPGFAKDFATRHGGPPGELDVGARYLDRLERCGGEWRISARTSIITWHSIRPASDWPSGGALGAVSNFERRDRQDIVYQYLRR